MILTIAIVVVISEKKSKHVAYVKKSTVDFIDFRWSKLMNFYLDDIFSILDRQTVFETMYLLPTAVLVDTNQCH